MKKRARELLFAIATAISGGQAAIALAQTPPPCCPGPECPSGKAVRITVPYSPGGAADAVARLLARDLGREVGSPYVVENIPGAGGLVGASAAAKMRWADGFLVTTSQLTVLAAISANLPFVLGRDLQPVAQIAISAFGLAVPRGKGPQNLAELVTRARDREVNIGTSGTGSVGHLALEQFKQVTSTRMAHVPYRGPAPAIDGLLAGTVDGAIIPIATALPDVKSGRLSLIAVFSQNRLAEFPEVPTVAESLGPNVVAEDWIGVFAAGTTPECTKSLGRRIMRIAQSEDFRRTLAAMALAPARIDEERFATFVASETTKWARIARTAGVKAE